MGCIGSFIKDMILDSIKYIILKKVAMILKILVILSAVCTLVGVIGFKVTAGGAKSEIAALIAQNDTIALTGVLEKVVTFSGFIRVGAILMLIFAVSVLVVNFIAGFAPVGSIGGVLITGASFILSFQILVYRSVSAIMEKGPLNLISENGVIGMIPVNFILGLTIAELLSAILGLFTLEME